jgi:hypothetical protein
VILMHYIQICICCTLDVAIVFANLFPPPNRTRGCNAGRGNPPWARALRNARLPVALDPMRIET